MPIAINPEHQDLADSVRSLVARVAPSEVLHAAMETPLQNPPPYWHAAADQGLQGVHLSESVGGQGFGLLELAIVLAEFGYGAVPGPFVPSAIAGALIAAHDPQAKVLASVPGTSEAQLALLQAKVPRQATLKKDAVKLQVVYAGPPQFKPIPGTSLTYAVNTSFQVIDISGKFYVCYQGAWFEGP